MSIEQSAAVDEARRAAAGSPADHFIERLADRTGARAGVQAVFGEAVQRGELTIIPVARTRWFYAGGAGSGGDPTAEGGYGSGSGGGSGVVADPVGFVEIGPAGTKFEPIVQPYPSPLFLLAAGIAAGMILRALARFVRG